MNQAWKRVRKIGNVGLSLLAIAPLACDLNGPLPLRPYEVVSVAVTHAPASVIAQPAAEHAEAGPLQLPQLYEIARREHPDLARAFSLVTAAQGRMIQAGLYPNPLVGWSSDDMGARERPAGKQGPIFTQQIVTAGKLQIAQAAAAAGVSVAEWQAMTRWYDILTRIRLAYFELLTARRDVEINERAVELSKQIHESAVKLQAAGAGSQPDVLRAQVDLDVSKARLGVAQQRLAAAGKLLTAAVGVSELPAPLVADNLEKAGPTYDFDSSLHQILTRSSEVQETQAMIHQGEELVRRARAEVTPNLTLTLRPFYHFPEQNAEGAVELTAPIPFFNRNQGNILTAEADLARFHQEARLVELRLKERFTLAYQRYQAARQQVEAYEKQILPEARESLRLVRFGYDRGDPKYNYTTLFDTQRTLVQASLAYVAALGEYWRGVSELAGLLQQDEL